MIIIIFIAMWNILRTFGINNTECDFPWEGNYAWMVALTVGRKLDGRFICKLLGILSAEYSGIVTRIVLCSLSLPWYHVNIETFLVPTGIRRNINVKTTSNRRHDVDSTCFLSLILRRMMTGVSFVDVAVAIFSN